MRAEKNLKLCKQGTIGFLHKLRTMRIMEGRKTLPLKHQTPIVEKKIQSLKRLKLLQKPFTFNLSENLALRIYPDNRPKNLEVEALQKGLVLMVNDSELIEEGVGFGVPVIKYRDATFFSRTATVYVEEQNENSILIVKDYLLDSISEKQIHGASINNSIYSIFHKAFEKAYIHPGNMRPLFDWTMRLRRIFGVETYFAKVPPRGKVSITYHCYPDHINVCADFSKVDTADCCELLILNEQGAAFFKKYKNGNVVLHDRKIGPWTEVDKGDAELTDTTNSISFSMNKKEGTILYCGWEQVKDRFSWAGMTYSLNPKISRFNYTIRLKEGNT